MQKKNIQGFLYVDLVISILIIGIWFTLMFKWWNVTLQQYINLQQEDLAIQKLIYYGEKIKSRNDLVLFKKPKIIVDNNFIIEIIPTEEIIQGIALKRIKLVATLNNKKLYEILVYKSLCEKKD